MVAGAVVRSFFCLDLLLHFTTSANEVMFSVCLFD